MTTTSADAAPARPTGTRGGFRWVVIGLIGVATVINYIDRNALSVMWPQISEDLGVGKEEYALVLTFFTIFYAIGQSAFGKIFDAIGTRIGFVLSIAGWSLAIALHAVAGSVAAFCGLRAGLGFTEAGNWPGAAKANAEWFPSRERALAQGLFNAGASVGGIVSTPLVALLFLNFGWRATFVVIGLLGLLWVIPWLFLYRAGPDKHPWVSARERAHILDGAQPAGETSGPAGVAGVATAEYVPSWSSLLRHRQSWGIILCRFFIDPIWWLFISWLPIYLVQAFGFDIKQIGLFGWVPYVGAAIGSLFGGWLSGSLIRRGWAVGRARKTAILLGAAVMVPALLLTIGAAEPLRAVLLIAVVLFGFQVAIGNIQTLPSDYFSGKSVGSLAGLSGTAAVLGVLVTTWLVPAITAVSFGPVFAIAAALVPLSILSLFVLGGKVERLQDPALKD